MLGQALTRGHLARLRLGLAEDGHLRGPDEEGQCKEKFDVNNYDDNYSRRTHARATATTFSDNSVFAQLGIQTGTKRIARLARRMGVRTPVSSNYAMTLGGLKQGVTRSTWRTPTRRSRSTAGSRGAR